MYVIIIIPATQTNQLFLFYLIWHLSIHKEPSDENTFHSWDLDFFNFTTCLFCSVAVTVSGCWTVSGARWTVMERLIWTNPTVPCRRSVSGALLEPRVRMQTVWDWWVSGQFIRSLKSGIRFFFIVCVHPLINPFPLSFYLSCRWRSGFSQHDKERSCRSCRWRHYGMYHGVGAGCVRVQTPDPQALASAHVTTGSTRYEWQMDKYTVLKYVLDSWHWYLV